MKKTMMQELILTKELNIRKKITLTEAMELLNISESTARRLFGRLEKGGQCIRGYGSITLSKHNDSSAYKFENVESIRISQKEKIAKRAIKLVEPGDIIYLDSGTTVYQFGLALAEALKDRTISNITVFTNSFVNLINLNKYVTVNLIGGEYRDNRKDFCGYIAEETIKGLHFTKCFLGTDGYSKEKGFTTTDFNTARLNSLAIENSENSIILMDSSKFNTFSMVGFSKNNNMTTIITDNDVTRESEELISSSGITLIIAD